MLGLSDLKQTKVYQEAFAEGEERGERRGEQRGEQRGIQQGERLVVENLLKVRFGELDSALAAIIDPILELPPEEFTPLLMQLSREELLARLGTDT
ncbi:MAG: hypothetical protein ACRDEA_04040 [Microcystaceae cyanobacterium]